MGKVVSACLFRTFRLCTLGWEVFEEECWKEAATERQRGSGKGEEGVSAESAGSTANRRGSSVNGVNEEWEQTKCAEKWEVPLHWIGRCCLLHTHSHKQPHTLVPLPSQYAHHLFSTFWNTCFFALSHTYICNLHFHTHPLALALIYTSYISSPVLLPYVPLLRLIRYQDARPGPKQVSGEQKHLITQVRWRHIYWCGTDLTQLIEPMAWQVFA